MKLRARAAAGLLGLAIVATACSSTVDLAHQTSGAPVPTLPQSVSPVPTGARSAAAVLAKLCPHVKLPPTAGTPPEGPTPPVIARIEHDVEQIRGLSFTQQVAVDPVTHTQLVDGLRKSFDMSFPAGQYRRRSLAWATIGVIPAGTSLRQVEGRFYGGQVIGYYDLESKQLVFIGTKDPTPVQQVTLAHELTHAIDDQNFGIQRVYQLGVTCEDEAATAALATVEGNATYFMTQFALRFLTPQEQLSLLTQNVPSTAGIPPMVVQLGEWPYKAGFAFITYLNAHGGLKAIDDALQNFPVSTEQIIHPDRYPNDVPQPLDIPDLGPKLGSGWSDLDVMDVGEEWLSILLDLRLDSSQATGAAAGWDGAIYRAWSDGNGHIAVLLSTVWDTTKDASQFATAMSSWIDSRSGQAATVLPASDARVTVLFASDAGTLAALRAAAGV